MQQKQNESDANDAIEAGIILVHIHIHASMYPDRLVHISDTSRTARFCSPDSQLHFREESKQTPPCDSLVAPQHFGPVSLSPFRLGSPWQRHLAHVCERNSSFKTQQPLHRASRRAGHVMAAAPSSHSTVHFSAKLETDIPFLENAEVWLYPLRYFGLNAIVFMPHFLPTSVADVGGLSITSISLFILFFSFRGGFAGAF